MKTLLKILWRILAAPFIFCLLILSAIKTLIVRFFLFLRYGLQLNIMTKKLAEYEPGSKEIYSAIDDERQIPNGVYKIHWKKDSGGGFSYASIGVAHDGSIWIAPSNWTGKNTDVISSSLERHKHSISGLELIAKK